MDPVSINIENDFNYFVRPVYDFTFYTAGLTGRMYVDIDRGSWFFLDMNAGALPVSLDHSFTYQNTTATPPSGRHGFNASGVGVAAGLYAGAGFKVGAVGLLSFKAGYEYAALPQIHGRWIESQDPARDGVEGVVQTTQYMNGTFITFLPDDPADYAVFGIDESYLYYSHPMRVDLSGLRASLDFAFGF